LLGLYSTLVGGFGAWMRISGRELPQELQTRDLVLITVATHKLSRLLARDRVTSVLRAPFTRFQDDAGPGEVDEAARGSGIQRAIGELVICPYCLGMWAATGLVGGLAVAPRMTRLVAATFSVLAGADALQIAYAKAESAL
jgi:hypothetical protein